MHPPFHQTGDPSGDFYGLAYTEGMYVAPTGHTRHDGFLVLYYSPSPDFTRFSFQTCTRDGRMLSYTRGDDRHDTLEFALLTAWYQFEMPPHAWRLYPAGVAHDFWRQSGADHAASYEAMRKLFCSVLYVARMRAWSMKTVTSLFQPIVTDVSNPLEATPENEEIFRSAFADTDDEIM